MAAREAAIAATRFGLGPRPGDLAKIGGDARGWVSDQLNKPDSLLSAATDLPTSQSTLRKIDSYRRQRRQMRRGEDAPAEIDPAKVKLFRQQARQTYLREVDARIRASVLTGAPLRERLARFWANHFTTSATKGVITPIIGAFEREAIRPLVLGRFADLLIAAESHPTMILYLDNHQSFGPNSPIGRRRNRGLNENLAREILELHTLGVDGGYDQKDVTNFAKILTGWTIAPERFFPGEGGTFKFVARMHEPGRHRVLGKAYAEDGVDQPRAVLQDLARHPATARHIATKLVRHFVADEPPPGLVGETAAVFEKTDGDLREVTAALLTAPEAWAPEQKKFKAPEEFVLSALRGLGLKNKDIETDKIVASLMLMGQRPFAAPSPKGWPDEAAFWASPDGVLRRIEWAALLGDKVGNLVNPLTLLDRLLGPLASRTTVETVRGAESFAQGVALVLSSPEFQRR